MHACSQDKDAKVNYLQKIIDVVGLVLNEHVPAKPLKVRPVMDFKSDACGSGSGNESLHALNMPVIGSSLEGTSKLSSFHGQRYPCEARLAGHEHRTFFFMY